MAWFATVLIFHHTEAAESFVTRERKPETARSAAAG
jgi:hypothetical protein